MGGIMGRKTLLLEKQKARTLANPCWF